MARSFLAIASLAVLAACGSAQAGAPDAPPEAPAPAAPAITTLPAAELADLVAAGEVRLIDVRSPQEFAEGHIPGAVNMPVESFDPAAVPQDVGVETVLYCRSGRRSAVAADLLAGATGQPVLHLDGGILAWEAAGQPVESGTAAGE